jgi:hypothetical protein
VGAGARIRWTWMGPRMFDAPTRMVIRGEAASKSPPLGVPAPSSCARGCAASLGGELRITSQALEFPPKSKGYPVVSRREHPANRTSTRNPRERHLQHSATRPGQYVRLSAAVRQTEKVSHRIERELLSAAGRGPRGPHEGTRRGPASSPRGGLHVGDKWPWVGLDGASSGWCRASD